MTRKKVKLAYITNDSARKATFKKRQKGLIKKVEELSTLCGVDACTIIYGPYDSRPEVWPSPEMAEKVVSEFRTLPEMDQSRKMVNQESFLRQRISKAVDQLRRQTNDNREKQITEVMFQCLVGNMEQIFHLDSLDLSDLGKVIDQYLKDINRREEILKKSDHAESSSAAAASSIAAGENPHRDYQRASVYDHQSGPSMASTVDPMERHQHHQQQQPWYVELMNRADHMGFGSEQMGFAPVYSNDGTAPTATAFPTANSTPTANANANATSTATATVGTSFWSNGFFP